uniref:transformation/transcription domain-associated protein-like n=1 Tax=Myxine glutinosa TaxID=7769 RepID=UPI00359021B0
MAIVNSVEVLPIPSPFSTQEEADTRHVLHYSYAASNSDHIIIISADTDVLTRYFESPHPIPENMIPPPEMVGMITSLEVKMVPDREDSETCMHTIIPKGTLSLKVLAKLPITVLLMYQLYQQSIHTTVADFIPLIMNTVTLQVSSQAKQHELFNKELYADFIAAQIKTLFLLANLIGVYQDLVSEYSQQIVKGVLQLLAACPPETAHLREELLNAANHILTTKLHNHFIPQVEKLFDESILIGSGYTVRETLRPLAYTTLADLVHRVRQHLSLPELASAVCLFARNLNDETLPSSIQKLSCKLLLNLVECISTRSEQEGGSGHDLLLRMLEVFVLKFRTITKYHLPAIFKLCKPQAELSSRPPEILPPSTTSAATPNSTSVVLAPSTPGPSSTALPGVAGHDAERSTSDPGDTLRFGVADCRGLVNTLVHGVKAVTWGIVSCKSPGDATPEHKPFQPKETHIYINLLKYALQALDIYQVHLGVDGQTYLRADNCQTVRIDEKEVIQRFASVFMMLNPLTFKDIFQTTFPYLVERFAKNYTLQIIANSFLANRAMSALFATILVEFLLERLPEMGSNLERSNLCLKLFKLVFIAVSSFAEENEQMLKPHLHRIVTSTMELMQGAKDPFNYLLLLRGLFHCISVGSHDLLYQEFLPLLPNLLQGLTMLQSGLHKHHVKELFVELCLTVPMRLSSLLPHLHMLMGSIVSALSGSQTLVSQGLRTLELCVDNVQPDFMDDYIQPVHAQLMQALWRALRNPAENISLTAYRVLGKFGGSNRKMLKEPQKLCWRTAESDGPSVTIKLSHCKTSVQLPMEKAIETALDFLKSASTEPYYWRQAWDVVRCFLVAMMSLDDKIPLHQLLSHSSFTEKLVTPVIISHRFKAHDTPGRRTFEQALTGAFMSAAIKDLRPSSLSFMVSLVHHYTMVAVAQQAGPFPLEAYQASEHKPSTEMFHSEQAGVRAMDPLVLVDAIAVCMAHEEKELCKIGEFALGIVFDVASVIMGSKERASQLPLFSYVVERLCACCYEQASYAKRGGCVAIEFLMKRLPLTCVLQHLLTFLTALLFVMMDLTGEVSNGVVDLAKSTLEQLLLRCASPPLDDERTPELVSAQKKAVFAATHKLVQEVTSPNGTVRHQAMRSLHVLARANSQSVAEIMEPHKEVLQDMIPPTKHLLSHQPANVQIALMEANTFCTTLKPRLFSMDLNSLEHGVFLFWVLKLCEAEDAAVVKWPCFESLPSLVPLRVAALNVLASCNYLPKVQEKVIAVLFKALNSTNDELQKAGEACMEKFLEETTIGMDHIHNLMRPLLMLLEDYRSLTLNVVRRFMSVTHLFPSSLNDKFCCQIMQHLQKWMEVVMSVHKDAQCTDGSEMKICAAIINLFHLLPAAPHTLVKPLLEVVMKIERAIVIEAGSPFREPLIKFLTRYPTQTVELFMMEGTLNDPQWSRMFMRFLKHSEAKKLRDVLAASPQHFFTLLSSGPMSVARPASPTQAQPSRLDSQFIAIKIISIIVRHDEKWLPGQPALASHLRRVWISDAFQERHRKEHMVVPHWKEPKLLALCLLNYCRHHYGEMELLFQLLRGLTSPFLCHLTCLKDYLEKELPRQYSVQQKRALFFKFVEIFHDSSFPEELKAKVLQHVLLPAFQHSLEHGDVEVLLGPANPEGDNLESISSVFINKVLEPERRSEMLDALRIAVLQFSALLVEHASHHIYDDNNESSRPKLQRLMAFTWPCLLTKTCVDSVCKYHGHLVLAHIIAKVAIHKKIVLQVFISLLKAHSLQARPVVRQALAILTPAVPTRIEEGYQLLAHWIRKVMVEEGHALPQLMHILHLLVEHHRVYYPFRHTLVQHMVAAMQRLGFTPNASLEKRKLAIDVADVIVKWEVQRDLEVQAAAAPDEEEASSGCPDIVGGVGRAVDGDGNSAGGSEAVVPGMRPSSSAIDGQSSKPIDKQHADTVVNFFIRIACQVKDQNPVLGSAEELLSCRCITLLKIALKSEMCHGAEIQLQWFDKLLMTVEQGAQVNLANVCTGLEVLSFLLTVLPPGTLLLTFKPLQGALVACMSCPHTKVLRAVQDLLSRLMSSFPLEPSTSRVAELDRLYAAVGTVIYEGLTSYDKSASSRPTQLFGTFLILKSACINDPTYIDRLLSIFMRSLQKMVRHHLSSQSTPGTPDDDAVTSELIVLGLELVKNRLAPMNVREGFLGGILASLLEKSPDPKILCAIVRITEEWMKNTSSISTNQQTHTHHEKRILLVKMMTCIEKRFPDDVQLNMQFLELVNYIYRDKSLAGSELRSDLQPAFLAGLRCFRPQMRAKFFEVFDGSIRNQIYDRLLYITCSQNWEALGKHFWIKQCTELLLAVFNSGAALGTACWHCVLPSITHVLDLADNHDRAAFTMACRVTQEPRDSTGSLDEDMEIDIEMTDGEQSSTNWSREQSEKDVGKRLHLLTSRHHKFLDSLRDVKGGTLLTALAQLCHSSTALAESTWIQLFPRLWKTLSAKQQHVLAGEIPPFLCSGIHLVQRGCQPSALACFLEAVSQCVPPIPLRPWLVKYIGRTHNMWQRAGLMLEQQAKMSWSDRVSQLQQVQTDEAQSISPGANEAVDALAELYCQLEEEDIKSGLWIKCCNFSDTALAITYEQHGFFEKGQATYEQVMRQARERHNTSIASTALFPEYRLWEDHWIRSCKELGQWEPLTEYGLANAQPQLVLDCAWRTSNWTTMKNALPQVELNCPREQTWKLNLHRGYLAMCLPEEQRLTAVEHLVKTARVEAIQEWRRLPLIVSHVHTPLLQAAQQIMELQEAAQIHIDLLPVNLGHVSSLRNIKTILQTWQKRVPVVSDSLSHCSSIFMWRQHHYQAIASALGSNPQSDPGGSCALLAVHGSASAVIQYGKMARRQGLMGVALDSLSRIHTVPSMPVVDCFDKIKQQVKYYQQLAGVKGTNECMQGLELIESTNLKLFTKEMAAEFFALKGKFLAQINKSEEANKAFSAAVQLHDSSVKAWAMWGDYLEALFVKERQMHLGSYAITCYLHACHHKNEHKARKYLAKVLWLLSFDDEKSTLAKTLDKYYEGVPPIQWVSWIPQLLTCLVGREGPHLFNLISKVARAYPQAVYFPLRTLYLMLKKEQFERDKTGEASAIAADPGRPSAQVSTAPSGTDPGRISATSAMLRCSRIINMQLSLNPTLLSALEGIVDQMGYFQENWDEKVLRQLRQVLAKCYSEAFEKQNSVAEARITPHMLNFVTKLVSTFGLGLESKMSTPTFTSATSESLARRARATAKDPAFQDLKGRFTKDFDFNVPGSTKLHRVISRLKKWIKILEAKIRLRPKYFLIEEKSHFLSNFSAQTAEVAVPGECLLPKPAHHYINIARFMPRVEIVQNQGTAVRRLYIRGHNGRLYPFLVTNDACPMESRSEERVLHILRLLNPCLEKCKETARRHLHFTVPRVVAVSPYMRLVEDNPSSLSLLEIYKQCCERKGLQHDKPILRFYNHVATVQARGSQIKHKVLLDILKEVQDNMVPRGMLKEWALQTFLNCADYWAFRKMFTLQLALLGFVEFVLHLNQLNPEMLQIVQDTGQLSVDFFRFDIDDATGDLDTIRPVPFRITPNISEFLTPIGVSGPLTASMIAVARCFAQNSFKVDGILKAVLRDEIVWWQNKTTEDGATGVAAGGPPETMDSEQFVTLLQKAADAVLARLHSLAVFDGAESKLTTLVAAANSPDNLCRMDPTWHPWL